jgi:hypothetical protein
MVVKGKPQVSNVRDDYIPVYGEGKAIQAGDYAQMAGGSQLCLTSLRLIVCADGLIRAKRTSVDYCYKSPRRDFRFRSLNPGLPYVG